MQKQKRFVQWTGALLAVGLGIAGMPAHAVVSVDTGSYLYTQDFNALSASGTANAWTNDTTLTGWFLYNKDLSAITSYRADNGSSNTGSFYSYGATGSSDRALGGTASGSAYFGSPASGAVAGWIAVAFQNNTGTVLNGFSVKFDGEQWRNGGNSNASYQAQTMVLQYGFGSSFASVSQWQSAGNSFNWTAPVTTTSTSNTGSAVDGNGAGLVANVGGTVATNWNAGDTLWLRWAENNDVGNDHGLAIDDFSLSVSAVPEPENIALMLAGLGMLVGVTRRRLR